MNLKEQMQKVGFNTDKILIVVDGERSKAIGITRLTNILVENGLNAYDRLDIETEEAEQHLKEWYIDAFNKLQELKKDSDIIINITINENKAKSQELD